MIGETLIGKAVCGITNFGMLMAGISVISINKVGKIIGISGAIILFGLADGIITIIIIIGVIMNGLIGKWIPAIIVMEAFVNGEVLIGETLIGKTLIGTINVCGITSFGILMDGEFVIGIKKAGKQIRIIGATIPVGIIDGIIIIIINGITIIIIGIITIIGTIIIEIGKEIILWEKNILNNILFRRIMLNFLTN